VQALSGARVAHIGFDAQFVAGRELGQWEVVAVERGGAEFGSVEYGCGAACRV